MTENFTQREVGLPPFWRTARELAEETPPQVEWTVGGMCARRAITEIVASIKGGKSTFIGHLVRAVLAGDPFLGQPTKPGEVVWITEERPASFRRLLERVGLVETDGLHILMLQDTRGCEWPTVGAEGLRKALDIGAEMMIVDTIGRLASLAGDAENNAGAAQAAMEPLEAAAAAGLAVIMGRHSRKAGGEPQEAGRGSSAWSGVSDIVIQLTKPGASHPPTVRKVSSVSRFEETPDEILIQLTDRGYQLLGSEGAVAFAEAETLLRRALADAGGEMPQADLLRVRDDQDKPVGEGTARRVLEAWQQLHKAERIGQGGRRDPLRWRWLVNNGATPPVPVALSFPGLNGSDDKSATPPSPVAPSSVVAGGRLTAPRPDTEGGAHVFGAHDDDLALDVLVRAGPPPLDEYEEVLARWPAVPVVGDPDE